MAVVWRLDRSACTRTCSGTDDELSIDDVFTPLEAPGLARQPRFLRYAATAELNYREPRGNPRRGGRYAVAFQKYVDQDDGRYSFDRVEIDLQQYVPLVARPPRAGAARRSRRWRQTSGRGALLSAADARRPRRSARLPALPFPRREQLLLQAEYRWEIFTAMDGAIFYDAGTVAARPSELSLGNLESDYGIGFRFGTEERRLPAHRGRVRQPRGQALHLEVRACVLGIAPPFSGWCWRRSRAWTLGARGDRPASCPTIRCRSTTTGRIDASGVTPIEGSNGYDFAEHTFGKPGDRRDVRAVNVNTIDEVPDSSWFTNRIGRRAMSIEEIVRGPNQLETINIDDWPIVQEKSSGITPGYRVTDPTGHLYQVKFDPPEHPEMASSAEVIGAAIYHALGYNVVQGYAVDVDPDRIVISDKATTVDMSGRRRPMRRDDVDRLLARAARLPNGKYRATLSRFAEGRAGRLLQVLRHAPRRPQRHPPARASPRAARQPRVRAPG